MQVEYKEDVEVRQPTRLEGLKRTLPRMWAKGRMDAHNRWWGCELLASDCKRPCLDSEYGKKKLTSDMSCCRE